MHLFLAIDAEGLDLSHIEDPAHLVVQDWGRSLQDSQNLCSFFIPSLRDPSVSRLLPPYRIVLPDRLALCKQLPLAHPSHPHWHTPCVGAAGVPSWQALHPCVLLRWRAV